MNKRGLAIFDLDYTLTRRGTWGRFMWLCLKPYPWKWPVFIVAAIWAQLRYKQGKLPRIAVKRTMMRWAIRGWSKSRLESLAETFADMEVPGKLRPGGLAALKAHKQSGDHILIASAAADLLVAPIAERLGIENYVATEMGWSESEHLTDDFATPNCYGPEKLSRVQAYMNKAGLDRQSLYITVYSDSHADEPLFHFADKQVLISPSKRLKAIATHQNWQVDDWSLGYEM